MIRRTCLFAVAIVVALVASGCTRGGGRTLFAIFDDVGDLVTLSNVQQSDAVVGRVTDLELTDDWNAKVKMELNPGVVVPSGTRAVIRATSLLGEKFVALELPSNRSGQAIPDGGTIPVSQTGKAPVLEEVFSQLGGILSSGALSDLGTLTTALARIVEGQEEDIGAVVDGAQRLVASLASQREALATSLENLASSAETLAENSDVVDRFLETSSDALGTLASQREELGELIRQLDRLGQPQAAYFNAYKDETDRQIKALLAVVDKVHEARPTLDTALANLPDFARLFADAIPGDYIQLDILIEGLPAAPSQSSVGSIFWGAVE